MHRKQCATGNQIYSNNNHYCLYRSEEIEYFLVPCRIFSYHTNNHDTLQTRTNRKQRLLLIKATAKSDSWVAHLLVLSTDIIRRYCPKRKQQFSSIRFQGTKKTYLVVWNIRT